MSPKSVREYGEAMRRRYGVAGKKEKGQLLDEFCQVTGYHRKSAIRLLGRPSLSGDGKERRGRPRRYDFRVSYALKKVWEVSDRICSKRLAPFVAELVAVLERQGEITLEGEVREKLLGLSAATIDRLLKPFRHKGLRRPFSSGRSSGMVKSQVPVRTFGEWEHVQPGSLQGDLVAHCGESAGGFYLTTLVAVDVATGWTECQGVWGKGKLRVGSAVHHIRQRLPFPLRELHTDNGSEFLNDILYPWCRREGIRFTRGRPYKKNDQAYAEQKNWSVVRRLVGYDRYTSRGAYEQLGKLYSLVRLYVNFFQPITKLVSKERVGAKVVKRYDVAKTPYQRLLETRVLGEAERRSLEELYRSLNPVQLRTQIDQALETLWKLADHHQQGKLSEEELNTNATIGNTYSEANLPSW